jgi:hypothetical protein
VRRVYYFLKTCLTRLVSIVRDTRPRPVIYTQTMHRR